MRRTRPARKIKGRPPQTNAAQKQRHKHKTHCGKKRKLWLCFAALFQNVSKGTGRSATHKAVASRQRKSSGRCFFAGERSRRRSAEELVAAGKPASDSVLTLRRNENGKLVAALPALPARYRFAAGFRPAAAAAGGEDRFLPVRDPFFDLSVFGRGRSPICIAAAKKPPRWPPLRSASPHRGTWGCARCSRRRRSCAEPGRPPRCPARRRASAPPRDADPQC